MNRSFGFPRPKIHEDRAGTTGKRNEKRNTDDKGDEEERGGQEDRGRRAGKKTTKGRSAGTMLSRRNCGGKQWTAANEADRDREAEEVREQSGE